MDKPVKDGAAILRPRKVKILFPEIYMVTREFGGPEEGGWWWDRRELLRTFPPRHITSDRDREYLAKAVGRLARFLNFSESRRPLSSVLSNGINEGFVVEIPTEHATKEIPRYE